MVFLLCFDGRLSLSDKGVWWLTRSCLIGCFHAQTRKPFNQSPHPYSLWASAGPACTAVGCIHWTICSPLAWLYLWKYSCCPGWRHNIMLEQTLAQMSSPRWGFVDGSSRSLNTWIFFLHHQLFRLESMVCELHKVHLQRLFWSCVCVCVCRHVCKCKHADRWSRWYGDEPLLRAYEVRSSITEALNAEPLLYCPQDKYWMASVNPRQLFSQTFEKSTLFTIAAAAVSPLNAESTIFIFIHEATTTGDDYLTDPVLWISVQNKVRIIFFFFSPQPIAGASASGAFAGETRALRWQLPHLQSRFKSGAKRNFYPCQTEGGKKICMLKLYWYYFVCAKASYCTNSVGLCISAIMCCAQLRFLVVKPWCTATKNKQKKLITLRDRKAIAPIEDWRVKHAHGYRWGEPVSVVRLQGKIQAPWENIFIEFGLFTF